MKPIHILNTGFHETQDVFYMETHTRACAHARAHTQEWRLLLSSFLFYFFIQEAVSRFAHVLVREKLT